MSFDARRMFLHAYLYVCSMYWDLLRQTVPRERPLNVPTSLSYWNATPTVPFPFSLFFFSFCLAASRACIPFHVNML